MDGDWDLNNTNISGCDFFDTPFFTAIAITRVTCGFITVLISSSLIVMSLCLEKHTSFTQRLVLFVCLSGLLSGLTIVTEGAHYFPHENEAFHIYCSISGFAQQLTTWSMLISVSTVTMNIYATAAFKKQYLPTWVHFLSIFATPWLVNWVPFINNKYGLSGPWCGIKQYTDNCTVDIETIALRAALWYLPLTVMVVLLTSLYVATYCKIQKEKRKYQGVYDPKKPMLREMLKKEIKPFMWYPFGFLILNFIPLINRIVGNFLYSTGEPVHALWILDAIFTPLTGAYISLVYSLDKETFNRLRNCNVHGTLKGCFNRKQINEYPATPTSSDSFFKTISLPRKKTTINDKLQ
jgi:hypothetical protein